MKPLPTFPVHIETLARVIAWAVEAAQEHVAHARFVGEEPDAETSMGLWQSFQAKFPRETLLGEYDVYVASYGQAFSATVKAIVKAFEDEIASAQRKAEQEAALPAPKPTKPGAFKKGQTVYFQSIWFQGERVGEYLSRRRKPNAAGVATALVRGDGRTYAVDLATLRPVEDPA